MVRSGKSWVSKDGRWVEGVMGLSSLLIIWGRIGDWKEGKTCGVLTNAKIDLWKMISLLINIFF